jgi:hypothetical protein
VGRYSVPVSAKKENQSDTKPSEVTSKRRYSVPGVKNEDTIRKPILDMARIKDERLEPEINPTYRQGDYAKYVQQKPIEKVEQKPIEPKKSFTEKVIDVATYNTPELKKLQTDIGRGGAELIQGFVGAPTQTIMQAVKGIESLVTGKKIDLSWKDFWKDIAPAEVDQALIEYGKKHPTMEQAARMAVEMAIDPLTYVGGGVADDLAKAGMIGKASRPSTEAVQLAAERQSRYKIPTGSQVDEVIPATLPEPVEAVQPKIEPENIQTPSQTIEPPKANQKLEALKRIRMSVKQGTPEFDALDDSIKRMEKDLQDEITTANPQQSEQIAEELRGLDKGNTIPMEKNIEPITLYHGSKNKFDIKDIRPNKAQAGEGIFLTDSMDEAKEFGENVYTLKIQPKKLATYKEFSKAFDELQNEHIAKKNKIESDYENGVINDTEYDKAIDSLEKEWSIDEYSDLKQNAKVSAKLKEQGYDVYVGDNQSGNPGKEYIVFNKDIIVPDEASKTATKAADVTPENVKIPSAVKMDSGASQKEPLTVYHGTNKDFKEFDKSQNKRSTIYGGAFYFTDSKKSAVEYATSYRANTGNGRIISANLKHDKLWDYNNDMITPEQFEKIYNYAGDYPPIDKPTKMGELKGVNDVAYGVEQLGYDGFKIIENDGSITYAVFKPEQIKQLGEERIAKATADGKITMAERNTANAAGTKNLITNPKTKAYQFENPEVKDYYQTYAKYILDDEFVPNAQEARLTEVMAKLKADTGLQPAEVKDALERLVKNAGQENVAAAKKVETVIDDMLTNGFDSVHGERVPPMDDYIKVKSEIEGREIKPRQEVGLDDIPVESNYAKPVERNIPKPAEKIKDTDQIGLAGVNVRDIKGKDGTVEKMISPYGSAWKDADGWNVDVNGKTSKVATEAEARKAIDSGMERTEVKSKKPAEDTGQMEMGETAGQYNPKSDNVDAPENKAFIDEYAKTLPDTEEALSKEIDKLQQLAKQKDGPHLLKINLQLFAAKKKLQEISKFKTNTLRKTPDLSDAEMQDMIDKLDMSYGKKAHADTIQKAKDMVEADFDGTLDRIQKNGLESAEDTAASLLIEKQLRIEGKQSGNYDKLKSWLKTVQRSGTSKGQTIEAFKIWQEDPDGMLKNATKAVEDAEEAIKKSNPEQIKQIDKETEKIIDSIDKTDKEAVEQIIDEVNKKADEILGKKKASTKKQDTSGKTGEPKTDKEELTPEDMLAKKIENYTKAPKVPDNDPIKDMVNELFRVAKESPIERAKVKSRSPIEFVSEALKNRQEFVETWKKAKEIVRENLKDNPEALAKLDAYFDKGIKPPFSSDSFNKSIREGMKELDQNFGQIVKDYYSVGSKSREDLTAYLVKKSGLVGEDAEVLAKYVQNRMKELTKEKKEEILKGIFKGQTAKAAKPGAIKSIEELSNVGAFVNENYKARVAEKLNPRLQKLINENFKGSPTNKAATAAVDNRIDFGELVRKSVEEIDFTRTKFLKEISEKLQVNDVDAKTILRAIESRFDEIVKEKRQTILGNMFKKREATVKKTGIQRVQEYIDKQVELENLGANPDAIRDFIKEKYGLPTLTNDDMAFITDGIDKLKGLEQGTRPYNETLWRIYNRIESKVPSTFIDKFRAWQRISMLPNVKTFTRNILGNVFMEKMENLNELTTEAFVDMVTSAVTGKREILGPTAAIQKSIAQTKGKLKGLSDVVTDIKHGVNTYDVQGQYEINISKNAFKNPVLNALEQFTNKTLQFGDRPFYEAAKARRLEELKILRKTKDVTDEMTAEATLYALDRTFQNNSQLSGAVLKAKKLMDNPVYETIVNVVIPFAKTPANILDKISDYTPIGLGKAIGHLGKTAGKGTFDQLYFSQRLGRMLTGSGILTLGYVLASKGVITGAPEKPGSKKSAFDRSTGKLSYAFKTPDGYIAYDWISPVGSLLALGADAYKKGMDKTSFVDKAMSGAEGAGNTFFNMSMMRNFSSLLNYGNPVGGLINTMLGAGQQFTPTGIKQAMKIGDKFERDTYDPDKLKAIYNQYKANIPGLRQELPIKTDAYGQPMEVQEGYGLLQKIFNIAANPATVTKSNMKDYETEVERLYNLKKNSALLPSVLDKVIEADNVDYDLSDAQFTKYKNLYGDIAVNGFKDKNGRVLIKGIKDIINSSEYKERSDEKKEEWIASQMRKAYNKAKSLMLIELKK